jgi:hypothetical protein
VFELGERTINRSRSRKMPSTKDKKDKMGETGNKQKEGQNVNDWRKDTENPRESEQTPRERSREQTAGTGRKTE